ncbi:acetolactate synthase large subunit [Pelomonas cellulosilytica]|uniref:Acetolactate synthase large subunit n=1 Tax=Pelomonas cellulosilytica TaxID=2906762 RepID=A0ABS8XQJ4_9BURK|nr:acetolactate synthase large subunit [Pelomonas sp. P8]MCE4555002.1 acetolactate synthase large subunit [Pelomonas sp. P8]
MPTNSALQPSPSGAVVVLQAAVASGVSVCFANPGTTEMPLVGALDQVQGIRAILGLFEGVCTGAADGYGRMLGRPASTLLHLGPGLANGLANLHNARRARTSILNIVGDHASWHLKYDAPLTSDIESLARPVSAWYRSVARAEHLWQDTLDGIHAAFAAPGGVATLVVPVDFQQRAAPDQLRADALPAPAPAFDEARVGEVEDALKSGRAVVLLLGDRALSERGQLAAGRIAATTGARLFSETFPARTERGGGLPDIDRLPYFPEAAIAGLKDAVVVLAGALAPVAYFGYEGLPSELASVDQLVTLALPGEAADLALERLAERLNAPPLPTLPATALYSVPDGPLTPQAIGRLLSNALPPEAIVSVEGGTCGYPFVTASARAAHHTILTNTGGAIGQGLPVALGAAVACPERRVFALQSDGSAQYTIQALWTMARERLPVVMLIASNRRYGILQTELGRNGIEPGQQARRLTLLDDPPFDWPALAQGYGVPALIASTTEELRRALTQALQHTDGPLLIEMRLA